MTRRRPLWTGRLGFAFILLVSLMAAIPTAAQDDATSDQILYLTQRPFESTSDQWNFTSYAPIEEEEGSRRQAEQSSFPTFRGHWAWYLLAAPTDWTIPAGAQWEVHVHVSGLEEVHPLPTFSSLSSGTLGYELRLEIRSGDRALAVGSTEILVTEAEAGIHEYVVAAEFREGLTIDYHQMTSQKLVFELSISGRSSDPDSPLLAHFGSTTHTSKVAVPGYPVEAFRALEDEYLLEKECQQLILQQRSCEELQRRSAGGNESNGAPENNGNPNGTNGGEDLGEDPGESSSDDEEIRGSPGPGLLLGLVLISWMARRFQKLRPVHFHGEPAGAPLHPSR
jgi:hypothetical protein